MTAPTTPRGDDDMLLDVYRDLMTGALVLVRNWFTNEPYCAQAEQLANQAICRAIAPRSEIAATVVPSAVAAPIPAKQPIQDRTDQYGSGYVDGWNACVDRMRVSAPQSATLRREDVLDEVIARLTKIQRMEVRGSERHALCEYMVRAVQAMNATDRTISKSTTKEK